MSEGLQRLPQQFSVKTGKTALQGIDDRRVPPAPPVYRRSVQKRLGLDVSPEEILITNGSQQCLDLIGKILIDPGDRIAIERPGYLGAIQVFSLYEPVLCRSNSSQEDRVR